MYVTGLTIIRDSANCHHAATAYADVDSSPPPPCLAFRNYGRLPFYCKQEVSWFMGHGLLLFYGVLLSVQFVLPPYLSNRVSLLASGRVCTSRLILKDNKVMKLDELGQKTHAFNQRRAATAWTRTWRARVNLCLRQVKNYVGQLPL